MAMRDLSDKARAVEAASVPRCERAGVVPASRAPGLIHLGDASTSLVKRAAITVALRRFRLDHGTYPNGLDQLAPVYMKGRAARSFTARQPEYRRSGAGFELPPPMPAKYPGFKGWKVSR
jgi:hypothetical protein